MRRVLLIGGLAAALAGCSGEAAPTTRGVYLLMDTSGTYTDELSNAQTIINAILAKLEPGDSFAVARVDTDIILTNNTLLTIAQERPGSVKELEEIVDIGPWKARTYGPDLLSVINVESGKTSGKKKRARRRS